MIDLEINQRLIAIEMTLDNQQKRTSTTKDLRKEPQLRQEGCCHDIIKTYLQWVTPKWETLIAEVLPKEQVVQTPHQLSQPRGPAPVR